VKLESLIENYQENIVQSLQGLVRIKSVEGKPRENMPFGEGPYKALNYMLDLAESMGFQTLNVDNYAGHIDLGDGEETVGMLVHLDVVPEGEGWTYPPFGAEIHNDKIYGRGTIDDKGPAIAALYAMKAVKESGLSIRKKVRMILGTNEETNWGGIHYYLKKIKQPDIAFVPDADFPVINGEKGILVFDLKKKLKGQHKESSLVLESIKGGNAPNMVPDACTAVLRAEKDIQQDIEKKLESFKKETGSDISLEYSEPEKIIFYSKGKSAHGSKPELGINAISQLMKFLGQLPFDDSEVQNFIEVYNKHIGNGYYGECIGCGFEDQISGKLILNVGMIRLDAQEGVITINIRYPITVSSEKVYSGIRETLKETEIEIIEKEDMKPIYIPKEHELVKKLMQVYQKATGDMESKPIIIGGGTYARAIKNAVAFGPLFPGTLGLEHQKDECISIGSLIKCAKIYAEAIYQLAK
jgi:succinyl-diaminopimelate desuccinylase